MKEEYVCASSSGLTLNMQSLPAIAIFVFGHKYKLLKVGARSLPVMYFSKTYFLFQEQRIFSFFVSEFSSSTDSNDLW